jgi:hypothetical protein
MGRDECHWSSPFREDHPLDRPSMEHHRRRFRLADVRPRNGLGDFERQLNGGFSRSLGSHCAAGDSVPHCMAPEQKVEEGEPQEAG